MDPLTLVIIVLLIIWATGAFAFPVAGSAIHLLLVIILVVVVIRLLQGRSVL